MVRYTMAQVSLCLRGHPNKCECFHECTKHTLSGGVRGPMENHFEFPYTCNVLA